jgi:UDP-N-acetylglucosamine acyltransferase
VEIGDNNVFRENVTVHSGTLLGNEEYKSLTKIGSNSLFMVGAHIAHDCIVNDNVVLANNATLGGHVVVGSNVVIGGLSAVKQFVRIGDYAMIGGMSGVENDVIPYGLVIGERASLAGLNLVGLKRHQFSKEDISNIKKVYGNLFDSHSEINFLQRVNNISQDYQGSDLINLIVEFILKAKKNPICKPRNYNV